MLLTVHYGICTRCDWCYGGVAGFDIYPHFLNFVVRDPRHYVSVLLALFGGLSLADSKLNFI